MRRLADIRFFFKHFPCGEASSGVAGVVLSAAPPLGGVSPFELSCTGLLISCVEAATLLCQSIVAATALTCMRSFIWLFLKWHKYYHFCFSDPRSVSSSRFGLWLQWPCPHVRYIPHNANRKSAAHTVADPSQITLFTGLWQNHNMFIDLIITNVRRPGRVLQRL